MSTKFSQFTAQSTVSDDDYINITGAQNRRIRWPDFLDNVFDRIVTPFIYPTIESLQEAPLRADQDNPVYVRVEETEYRLYKITTIEAGPDDITLDNGNVATAQTEYRDIGFVVGPESSTVGNLAVYDNTTGTLLADGPNPSTFGVNLIEFPDSALDGYMRKKNDNTLEIITAGQLKETLNLDQVNNTSDANKPISTATQSALDLKADTSAVDAIVLDLESQINERVQSVATIADLRALTGLSYGQVLDVSSHTSGNVGFGDFDVIGNGTDDDDGVFVSADGKQLKRRLVGSVTPMMFGALCNGTSDDTAAFQAMLDYIANGGVNQVLIPSNHIARVNNLSINSSVRFFGGGEIRRLDDCDIPAVGNLAVSPGVYVFDVVEPTAVVVFDNLTLDANQAAQTNAEPTGIFVRVGNMTTSDPDIRTIVRFRDVTYKNNCKLAIYTATGDNSDHRTIVVIDGKCSFTNGRFNTVDYDSDFIRVTDRTDLWIDKGTFEINEATGVDEYTFPAVRLTVQAATFGVDDGPRCWISNSYFNNLGRPSAAVDAIGVIDFYRQAKDVHITNCTFEDCNKSPVRGKTSAQRVTISENHMINCLDDYAINITPSSDSTPPNFGQYIIDGNIMEACAGMISVVANTTFTDPSFDMHITNNVGKDISGLNFAIYARRVAGIVVDNNTINGSTTGGIQLRECSRQKISRAKIYDIAGTTSDHGIWIRSSYGDIEISSCDVLTATGQGITATIDGSHSGRFSVNDCTTDGTQDYGIIANTGAFTTIRFASNDCTNIAGLDRGFYAPSTRSALIVIGNSTDAATPLTNSGGGVKSEIGNSWQMS